MRFYFLKLCVLFLKIHFCENQGEFKKFIQCIAMAMQCVWEVSISLNLTIFQAKADIDRNRT